MNAISPPEEQNNINLKKKLWYPKNIYLRSIPPNLDTTVPMDGNHHTGMAESVEMEFPKDRKIKSDVFGIKKNLLYELMHTPWKLVQKRMRCVPGTNSLAAELNAIQKAETTLEASFYDEGNPSIHTDPEVTVNSFTVTVNPLTTIPFPTY